MRNPRNQRREPTPPLSRHPSREGMGAVPLLGGVAEGRGGYLLGRWVTQYASHVQDTVLLSFQTRKGSDQEPSQEPSKEQGEQCCIVRLSCVSA